MKGCGIDDGDLLVIDKSIDPQDGDIVVAFIDGEFTLKKVKIDPGADCLWLMPANTEYKPIKVTEENNFYCMGCSYIQYKATIQKIISRCLP